MDQLGQFHLVGQEQIGHLALRASCSSDSRADFAKIIELFDKYKVSFVSIIRTAFEFTEPSRP
jgi:hypothetical protein